MHIPELYVFAISHYCEKTRWVLELLGIDYSLKFLPPGLHRRVARQLGAPVSSLPILKLDDRVIQGSANIIDWAESNKSQHAPSLEPNSNHDECRALEQRLDDILGVHIRRSFYSEALVEFPRTVLPVFTRDLPILQRLLTTLSWGPIRKVMIRAMDLGYDQGLQSRAIVDKELDWLDSLLKDGRHFLIGDHLSRADITAASLLAPLIQPAQHPTYTNMEIPPRAAKDCEKWRQRPSLQWTKRIYEETR